MSAFSSFLEILQTVAAIKGKSVVFVDKWFSSSKLCSNCGYKHSELKLRDREWACPSCGTHHLRDKNASLNIEREGASSLNLDTIRLPLPSKYCLKLESAFVHGAEYVNRSNVR